MIKGSISNNKNLLSKLSLGPSVIDQAMINANKKAVLMIDKEAKKLISSSKGGKKQTRYRPYREVNVSPPGGPPNTDTGRLIKSIKTEFEDGGRIGYVGTNLKYGAYLEFGTERMAPRPWLSTAVELSAKKIAALLETSINDGIEKAFGIKNVLKGLRSLIK